MGPSKKQKQSDAKAGDLPSLLDNGLFSDFTIKSQDQTFKVHRVILASKGGSYFYKLVNSGMKEDLQGHGDLSDDDPTVIKGLLDFLYDKGIQDIAPPTDGTTYHENLVNYYIKLYIVADKYDVPGLREAICARLKAVITKSIDDENSVVDVLDILFDPSREPAHCFKEMASAVKEICCAEGNLRTLMSNDDAFTLNLDRYGSLAAACARRLHDLLDAEENKLGNITAVMCLNTTCRSYRRRWTYKHGPHGPGVHRHCIWCGSTAVNDTG